MKQTTHIIALRKSKGWTQEKLAEKSQLSVRTIQRLESGNDASLETLRLVAHALGVSVEQLFEHVEDKDKEKEIHLFSNEQLLQVKQRKTKEQRMNLAEFAFFIVMLLMTPLLTKIPENSVAFAGILWVGCFLFGLNLIKNKKSLFKLEMDRKYPLTRGLGLETNQTKNKDAFLWWKQPVVRNIMMVFWGAIIPLIFILKYALHLF